MYKIPASVNRENWTLKNFDYKQLGIMLMFILNGSNTQDYHEKPSNLSGSHKFLQELYFGEYSEQLFDEFCMS